VVVDGEEDTRLLEALSPRAPFFLHLHPEEGDEAEPLSELILLPKQFPMAWPPEIN